MQQRPAAEGTHHVARCIHSERIGRSCEDDVVPVRIDEDMSDAVEAAQEQHLGGKRLSGCRSGFDGRDDSSQRNLTKLSRGAWAARHGGHRESTIFCER